MLVAEMCAGWKKTLPTCTHLYILRAHRAHHQERQIVSIQALVTTILCRWPRCVQVAHISATNIERLLPEAELIQFVSADDEHDVLETCRDLKVKINT